MRIGIDVRKIRDFGVGTYVQNLVRYLARLDHENEYVLFCRAEDCSLSQPLGENFRAVAESAPPYSMTEQFRIPFSLRRERIDLFHVPHYVLPLLTPCRSVVTIHDCIHLVFPQYLPNRLAYGYARASFWVATHRASRILTVSEASKRDILRFFQVPSDKVTVIHNAIADGLRRLLTDLALRQDLHGRAVARARQFSWERSVSRIRDIYNEVARQD